MNSSHRKTITVIVRIALGAVLVVVHVACSPRGEIAEESKTPECREDVEQALEEFRMNLGLDYYVTEDDLGAVLDSARLEKPYAGLGVRYVAHFGLDKKSDGCHLKFYKRTSREPGQTGSSIGNYGTVHLARCQCT